MKKINSIYRSLLHRVFGFRRAPLTAQRAHEILNANQLYTEITKSKPLKAWRRKL